MEVYLARHGEAVSEEVDPLRPLTEAGNMNIQRIGRFLARCPEILPACICHSPKARASQTAHILGKALSASTTPSIRDGLLPLDDPSVWKDRLTGRDRNVLLVGHLPHLSRLASLLLLAEPQEGIFDFTPGTVLCLEKTVGWQVKWMLSPEVLKGEPGI